jgi:hypothetical protein
MNSTKKTARLIGILSLFAVFTFAISFSWSAAIIGSGTMQEKLLHIQQQLGSFRIVILLEVLALAAGFVIAALFYNLLKPINATKATVALVLNMGAPMLFAVGLLLGYFPVTMLGKMMTTATAGDLQHYETIAKISFNFKGWSHGIALIFGSIGSLLNYYLLFQTKYIPRVLAFAGMLVPMLVTCGAVLIILLSKSYFVFFTSNFFFQISIGLWLSIKSIKIPEQGFVTA